MGARAGARGKNLFPVESAALAAALQRGEAAGSQPAGEGGPEDGARPLAAGGPRQPAAPRPPAAGKAPRPPGSGGENSRRGKGPRCCAAGRGKGPALLGRGSAGSARGPRRLRAAEPPPDASRPAPAHRVLLLHHLVHLLGDADDLVLRGHGCGCPSRARRGELEPSEQTRFPSPALPWVRGRGRRRALRAGAQPGRGAAPRPSSQSGGARQRASSAGHRSQAALPQAENIGAGAGRQWGGGSDTRWGRGRGRCVGETRPSSRKAQHQYD